MRWVAGGGTVPSDGQRAHGRIRRALATRWVCGARHPGQTSWGSSPQLYWGVLYTVTQPHTCSHIVTQSHPQPQPRQHSHTATHQHNSTHHSDSQSHVSIGAVPPRNTRGTTYGDEAPATKACNAARRLALRRCIAAL